MAESISFNISGRSLTYLLCYSHFWARGSSFLFLLHSTHQTSTFLPTAKVLVQLVCITAMPKRNQVRQRSQHARSCTNPTGNYHLKPKKHSAKPEDAACERSAGMERCSLRFQIPQQHRGRKENTSSEPPLLTTRPCCHLTVVPSRALLKSPGNLLALSGASNKCRKLSMETVQTRGSA